MTPDERERNRQAQTRYRLTPGYHVRHSGHNQLYHERHRKSIHATRRRTNFDQNVESVRFVSFDGEGSMGRYQLLACSATDEVLKSRYGLTTLQCLDYFIDLAERDIIGSHDALIGFGLGYDFENILRDLPDSDYLKLRTGKRIVYDRYTIRYVNRKFLDVWVGTAKDVPSRRALRLQDIYPYFQTSFVKACEQRGIELPEVVYEGKRNRGGFRYADIDRIVVYNRAELVAMVRLAESLRTDFVAAFNAVGITPSIGTGAWYGPGSQAISVLQVAETRQLVTRDDPLIATALNTFVATRLCGVPDRILKSSTTRRAVSSIVHHPFVCMYFGGRIEAAMQGRFDGTLYDYDLTSAYPYAVTRLPTLDDKKLVAISGPDPTERIAAYLVRWRDRSRPFHPFPYRGRNGNVYFPSSGFGWILSPELHSGLESGVECEIIAGFAFVGTEGYGRGYRAGDSTLAGLITSMGEHRAIAKRNGDPAHRGLKLLMNSVYGKTLQKEGSRRFFNAFVAAWITSVTRSRIYDLIGPTEPGQVISVMTDGVLSTVPLPVTLTDELGGWSLTEFDGGYQFAPGVYKLFCFDKSERCPICKGVGYIIHYRGFLRFDPDLAIHALDTGTIYESHNPVFVSRVMALHDKSLRKKRYQFVPIKRQEAFSLDSKRDMSAGELFGTATYYPPKESWESTAQVSWPYDAFGKNKEMDEDTSDVE